MGEHSQNAWESSCIECMFSKCELWIFSFYFRGEEIKRHNFPTSSWVQMLVLSPTAPKSGEAKAGTTRTDSVSKRTDPVVDTCSGCPRVIGDAGTYTESGECHPCVREGFERIQIFCALNHFSVEPKVLSNLITFLNVSINRWDICFPI